MKPPSAAPLPLLEPREALTRYLDSLFRDVAVFDEPVAATVSPPAPVTEPPAALVQPESAPRADAIPLQAQAQSWNGPVTCAVLQVGDLRLAVPLVDLHGIRRPGERLCRLPTLPPWVLGVTADAREARTQVADTALLLGRAIGQGEYPDLHVVTVAPGRWALACNGVEKTIRVENDAVRWRAQRNEDPWFAGVVAGELCALVDVAAMVTWLDTRAEGAASPVNSMAQRMQLAPQSDCRPPIS